MSTSARRFLAVTGGAAVLVALLPAVAANAADELIGIGVATQVGDDRGAFSVPVWTDTAGASITGVSATLRASGTTPLTLSLRRGGNGEQRWYTTEALRLAGADGGTLPHLGRYAIDVTATDSTGATDARSAAGTLDFTLRPSFDPGDTDYAVHFVPAAITETDRHTSATGVLLGERPGGAVQPIADHEVTLLRTEGERSTVLTTARTDADGRWTTAPFTHELNYGYRVEFAGDDDVVHGTAWGYGFVGREDSQVRLTAGTPQKRVLPGGRLTVSGSVRTSAGAAVGGVTVRLSLGSYVVRSTAVTTADDGTYRASIAVAETGQAEWRVGIQAPFLYADERSGTIVVPAEASLSGVVVAQATNGLVTARASLEQTYAPDQDFGLQATYLQRSPDGKTRWTTIAASRTSSHALKLAGNGYYFGYYRLYHPTSDGLAAVASTPKFLARHETRIIGNNAGPEPVRKGRTVTVTGTVQQYASGWKVLPRVHVELFFLARGAKKYAYVTSGRTNSRGKAVLHGKATKDGSWLLQYFGDTTHFDSRTTADYVDVR